ncbi:MAG TPA: phosphoribosylformylglycinamidine synthase [Candidatus Methylomirabilis sp.]|nr:phosphoribosylformylglycinamidine synthase [Candidatus Methylomirabilis sp.]
MLSFFRTPAMSAVKTAAKLAEIQRIEPRVIGLQTEWKFYVDVSAPLDEAENERLNFFLAETYEPEKCGVTTFFGEKGSVTEIGPRAGTVTSWSSSADVIFEACNLTKIRRIEAFCRYHLTLSEGTLISDSQMQEISELLHDRMTEQAYPHTLSSFDSGIIPEVVQTIPLLRRGKEALREFTAKYKLKFTAAMEDYICNYFINELKRDPTDVEIFEFGQLNSEHCRHHKFNAIWTIDGKIMPKTLMEMVRETFKASQGDLAVAFKDNAAVLNPHRMRVLMPSRPGTACSFTVVTVCRGHVIKIETHNHPTTISPYPGAGTGTAVERDVFGTGRGAVSVDQCACYYVGNLLIPGYLLPWEKEYVKPSKRFATPLEIIIQASNGASDDCNCKGKPITCGATRSFEQIIDNVHYGYRKTIMVAGCTGYIDAGHIEKRKPEKGMLIVQTGGPAFPRGVGGGSGSSHNAGGQTAALDFDSVQRFNAYMERLNFTIVRVCSELGVDNPIEVVTDLGAGGDGVALPELVFPAGGHVELREIPCGDKTMIVLVYVNNEAQERMVFLIRKENLGLFTRICRRARCPMAVVGEVTGDGRFVISDSQAGPEAPREQRTPVDVSMKWFLADLPQMQIECKSVERILPPPQIPPRTVHEHLDRVLRLLDVCSHEWATRKGDRTVGNRSVRQQEVGPLQLPLADCSVMADSPFGKTGMIKAIGEQPIIGLVNNEAGIRMSLGEAFTNAVWALVRDMTDLSFSATWQWPCGQPGEDARLYFAVRAAYSCLIKLLSRIGVGKDSLSMTLEEIEEKSKKIHSIVAPGTVQMVAFGRCVDIDNIITPDLKLPGKSNLMFIDLGFGQQRMGGSALLRVYDQIGNEAPDMDRPELFIQALRAVQKHIRRKLILSGHDRSDGGLIGTALEMAFGGNCGLELDLRSQNLGGNDLDKLLFNQELGLVIEFLPKHYEMIRGVMRRYGLAEHCHVIGQTTARDEISVSYDGRSVLREPMTDLLAIWRETSFQIDARTSTAETAAAWRKNTFKRTGPKYFLPFEPKPTPRSIMINVGAKIPVAVLGEAGSNGDRDMAEFAYLAGFDPWDVNMTDIIDGDISLSKFRGVLPVGGFALKDTFGAGKGWAGVFKFNPRAADEFGAFVERKDTFMFCPCNGCQFAPFLGILPYPGIPLEKIPRFIQNSQERFESQLVTVKVLRNKSIFFKDMEGSIMGIMVSHGEGRFHCPDSGIMGEILENDLAPLRYVKDDGTIAASVDDYPFNPNGSPFGIAGLVSRDGRFGAFMPHHERFAQKRLLTWLPREWRKLKASPTLKILQNAREWCEQA